MLPVDGHAQVTASRRAHQAAIGGHVPRVRRCSMTRYMVSTLDACRASVFAPADMMSPANTNTQRPSAHTNATLAGAHPRPRPPTAAPATITGATRGSVARWTVASWARTLFGHSDGLRMPHLGSDKHRSAHAFCWLNRRGQPPLCWGWLLCALSRLCVADNWPSTQARPRSFASACQLCVRAAGAGFQFLNCCRLIITLHILDDAMPDSLSHLTLNVRDTPV